MSDVQYDDLEAEAARLAAESGSRAEAKTKKTFGNHPANEFADAIRGHAYCLKPVMFIRRTDKEMVSKEAFDGEFNEIANTIPGLKTRYLDHAAKFAVAAKLLQKVHGTCYRPGQEAICDGMFNMWKDPGIIPLAEKPRIFFEHMVYLFPDKRERKLVVQWLAWAVQRPNEKLMFALYIIGEGGTGKSWLGKMLEVIFGEDNVSLLDDDAPLKSDFQEFKLHKRLLFVHEIAPDEKTDLVRSLKGFISESSVRVNRKNIERVKVENFCNLMGVSNYGNALKIVRNDRRSLVVQATDDVYGVDDRMEPTPATNAYYARLFDCIGTPAAPGDEARRILHYLMNFDLTGFNGKSLAPTTTAKDDVAANGESAIYRNVKDGLDARRGPFRFTLFTVNQVMEAFADVKPRDSLKAVEAEVSKAMIGAGCRKIVLDADVKVKSPQVYIDGEQVRLWAASKPLAARYGKMTTDQLRHAYKAEREAAPEGDPSDFEP